MKQSKPGFVVFFKTSIKHPLISKADLIFVSASGERFLDKGNGITSAVMISLFYMFCISVNEFSYKIWGLLLWVIVPVLYHFLRYFWTDFVKIDEENIPIEDNSLLTMRQPRKKPRFIVNILKRLNKDYDGEKVRYVRYVRYKNWQKALIILVQMILLAALIGTAMLLRSTPYMRSYVDPDEFKQISFSQPVENLQQAYGEAKLYINKRIPEAELAGYSISIEKNDILYEFLFKDPKPGIFIRDSIETAHIRLYEKNKYLKCDFFDNKFNDSDLYYGPISSSGLDIARITEIIQQEAGVMISDVDEIRIVPEFHDHISNYNYDPGGRTWAVSISLGGYEMYLTVDIDKGTAVKESDNKYGY